MKFIKLFIVFSVLFLFACNADQKEPTAEGYIFSSYYFRYLEPEQQLKAEATYRQGDSIQSAKAKVFNGVFFGDQEMTFKKLSDTNQRYILDAKKEYPSDPLTFSFINDKGHKEEQSFSLSPIKNLSANGPVSKSNGCTLSWEGDALGADESVVCLFTDTANKTTSTIIKGPSVGAAINIPAAKLEALTVGAGEVYLVRKKRSRKVLDNRQSFAQMEYYSSTLEVIVEE